MDLLKDKIISIQRSVTYHETSLQFSQYLAPPLSFYSSLLDETSLPQLHGSVVVHLDFFFLQPVIACFYL